MSSINKDINKKDRDKVNVYLVSMEKDKERRDNLNVTPDYIYAVDGSKLNIDELKKENKISNNCRLKRGEIGCYMSHIELIKKSLDSDKYVLILEDDAEIKDDTFEKINTVLETAPDDFELLFLGYNYYEEYSTFKKVNYLHGTQSYIVNPKNITLSKINNLYPIEKPYDVVIATKFKTYVVIPKIIELSKFGGYSNTQGIH
jgi:GR25 family glycosyltransferase involved in LPS biosynthesis